MDEWLDQLEFHNNRYSNLTNEIGFRDAIKMYLLSIVQRACRVSYFIPCQEKVVSGNIKDWLLFFRG